MQKTLIEWVRNPDGTQGYTSNLIKGLCKGGCFYCYARNMYKRFNMNPDIRFDECEIISHYNLKKPRGVFFGSTHDIFGYWIPDIWIRNHIAIAEDNLNNRYYFLTKNPERYYQFKFSNNCLLGITVTNFEDRWKAALLVAKKHSGVKFVSIEPLLSGDISNWIYKVDWLIVGAMTKNGRIVKKYQPKREWLEEIVSETRQLHVPLFMKNNLKSIWKSELIKEFPNDDWEKFGELSTKDYISEIRGDINEQ